MKAYVDKKTVVGAKGASEQLTQRAENLNGILTDISGLQETITRAIQGCEKVQSALENKIVEVSNSIGQQTEMMKKLEAKLDELMVKCEQKKAELNSTPPTIDMFPNLAYLRIQAEIVELERKIVKVKGARSALQQAKSCCEQIKNQVEEQKKVIEDALSVLESGDEALDDIENDITMQKNKLTSNSKRAVEVLSRIASIIDRYTSVTLSSAVRSDNGVISASSLHGSPLSINAAADRGCEIFLRGTGVEPAELQATQGDEKKIACLLQEKGLDKSDLTKLFTALAQKRYRVDDNGGCKPFYDTTPMSAGHAYEWNVFFQNRANGFKTEQQMVKDMSKYAEKKYNLFGYDEPITIGKRKTDVVYWDEKGREVHQELKVGRWKDSIIHNIRQELYADHIRLQEDPNVIQEYRIRRNSQNLSCLFNSKEQARYLLKMKQLHKDRVRIFLDDAELTVEQIALFC